MSSDYKPRTLIETSRHGSIDAELKSLKLLSRRLQSNLTLLATELRLLRRLFYKNKNQHRGALFWRNIAEVRRYLEKVDNLDLQDSIISLRNTFYGSAEISGSMKGPWTHFPSQKYLSRQGVQYKTAVQLTEKMSEACLRAYKSFHRSLQSAAFLQILLVFVAISSRTRAVSLELHEILAQTYNSTQNLLAIVTAPTHSQHAANSFASFISSREPPEILSASDMQVEVAPPSTTMADSSKTSSVPVIIERSSSKKARKDTRQETDNLAKPKKKKRKTTTDEIDDIFGF